MYDYVIVGAGLFGSTFANLCHAAGEKVLVIDRAAHIAGNCYSEERAGVHVHMYGPHIFHTSNKKVWDYVNQFTAFDNFVYSPKASSQGRLYSLPFNMNTFYEIWGVRTPQDAMNQITADCISYPNPQTVEEYALSKIGRTLYETLVKGYTLKQWMKAPSELPASILARLPLRFTYDNNYFYDQYQGIPSNGYTAMFTKMLEGIPVELNVDFLADRTYFESLGKKVIYTGRIDELFDYTYGELEYRTLDFEHVEHATDNHQGIAVINHADLSVPYTRTIEHKHFQRNNKSPSTIVTTETPSIWHRSKTPYYPIITDINNALYQQYQSLAAQYPQIMIGGRLGDYKYYDMHVVIGQAMKLFTQEHS
jgi:UDP-galactopyranose mutase